MADKIFADGVIVKRNEKAPDFVLCNLSIKCEDFEKFMKQHHKNGWINLNVQRSKSDKLFAELDTWEPKKQDNQQQGGYNAPPQNNQPPRSPDYDPEMGF